MPKPTSFKVAPASASYSSRPPHCGAVRQCPDKETAVDEEVESALFSFAGCGGLCRRVSLVLQGVGTPRTQAVHSAEGTQSSPRACTANPDCSDSHDTHARPEQGEMAGAPPLDFAPLAPDFCFASHVS